MSFQLDGAEKNEIRYLAFIENLSEDTYSKEVDLAEDGRLTGFVYLK
jgi:hypothetical protein